MSKYLDLRDLAKELEDLEGRNREPIVEVAEDALEEVGEPRLDEGELERLVMLQALDREIGLERYAQDEPTAIPEGDFERYAEELATDLGLLKDASAAWPLNHIDWKGAADELKQDYTSFDFDGETYLVRSI